MKLLRHFVAYAMLPVSFLLEAGLGVMCKL